MSSQAAEVSGSPSAGEVATRRVLVTATELNASLGHENLGFLSERHGFMPSLPPQTHLPRSHAAWDEVASELPAHYRHLTLRRAIASLPVLRADEDALADHALLRAGQVLAMLAHAYHYVEVDLPSSLPEALARPWAQVRRRLGREHEVLSYIDLIVLNWRLVDPNLPDPMRVENLRLLIPTVDSREERAFYLTQTEILAQCSPIIGAVVRAQEAIVRDDPDGVEAELLVITSALLGVVRDSLLKINPNPNSTTHVDPVPWAKSVAPFAVPFRQHVQGPSGTSSPIFNLLDAFLGREKHQTFLGKEIRALRSGYPRFWQEFLVAAEGVSLRAYVQRVQRPQLSGIFNELVEAYMGQNGFLGRHRAKVFGYIELAFKVGRSVTIGGFSGLFKDRTWDQVDTELEYARLERLESFPPACHFAHVKDVRAPHEGCPDNVRNVVLDVTDAGIRYEPGDRCGILPENSDALVEKTLRSLQATGDEDILLTEEWRSAVTLRPGLQGAHRLSLREVLRFGRIRPVVARVAEALHHATQSPGLLRAIVRQELEQWELWDLLEKLTAEGYDPTRMWKSGVESSEHVCRVVPPETFRMYSISSAMNEGERTARELHLTVGRVQFPRGAPDGSGREGSASSFLTRAQGREKPLSLVVVHPPRFSLPKDARAPVVMIAGGTGIAPFRGFLQERMRQPEAGETWLLLSVRDRASLYYADELREAVATGRLQLRVAFTRDDVEVAFEPGADGGRFVFQRGKARRIGELMLAEDISELMWRMLSQPTDGGMGPHVYVCGLPRFALAADEAMRSVIAKHHPGGPTDRRDAAEKMLARLMGEGRIYQEVFSGVRSPEPALPRIDVSEVARHNDETHGYWMIIDGRVYDLTSFIARHPGGARILTSYAGMDATQGYVRSHRDRSEIDAMREMYEIGVVRYLDFERQRVTCDHVEGAEHLSLAGLYRAWRRLLFLVVEMQNALRHDQSLQRRGVARGEPDVPRSAYRLQRAAETHERFMRSYLGGLYEPTKRLVELTLGCCSPSEAPELLEQLHSLLDAPSTRKVEAMTQTMKAHVQALISDPEDTTREACERLCAQLERFDAELIEAVKAQLLRGIRLFERHEARVVRDAANDLAAVTCALVDGLCGFPPSVLERLESGPAVQTSASHAFPGVPAGTSKPPRVIIVASSYWTLERDAAQKLVVLRRSVNPVETLDSLMTSNDAIIAAIDGCSREDGIVVDMRDAKGRNDASFEEAMAKLRKVVATRFARCAVLLESSLGMLQVDRLGRTDGANTFATQNEQAAFRFAIDGGRPG